MFALSCGLQVKGGADATAVANATSQAIATAIATAYASASSKTTVQGANCKQMCRKLETRGSVILPGYMLALYPGLVTVVSNSR